MDRTLEFRRLAGIVSSSALQPAGTSAFMQAALDQKQQIADLWLAQQRQEASISAINFCQAQTVQLELTVEDLSDLGDRAPTQSRDQVAHRRGVIASLYEELHALAAKVQSEQVSELQREAEVASYFTVRSKGSRPPKLRPPLAVPSLDESNTWSSGSSRDPAAAASLQAEEQRLLNTFTTDLDKIQETRAKIEEISAMVGLFATKVTEQMEQAEQIHEMAEQSTAYIETAEKHLNRAVQNSNAYRFYVVCWFVGSALFLLVFDYIDSRFSFI